MRPSRATVDQSTRNGRNAREDVEDAEAIYCILERAERDMFGSVADAVLRAAPIPILVLRPRRDAVRVPAGDAQPVTTARF